MKLNLSIIVIFLIFVSSAKSDDIDVKILKGNHWHWVSFPRLVRTEENYTNIRHVLNKMPSFPLPIDIHYRNFTVMEFNDMADEWNPHKYTITSEQSLKMSFDEDGYHTLQIQGEPLPIDHKLTNTLPQMSENWIGYWIPYSQNIKDAFGELFKHVFAVEAEDWFYVNNTQYIFKDKDVFTFNISHLNTPSSSTIGKNFEYGKGYILYFTEPINGFQWQDSKQNVQIKQNPEPQFFKVIQKANYIVIDVLEIPDDVIEIGIFINDECRGSKVVQNKNEQILVYTSLTDLGEIPYQFKIARNTMQVDSLESVSVYNKKLSVFQNNVLLAGKKKYSIIKLFGTNP